MEIVGVVDWEFTYAAPVEFSYAPPWWLLIEKPEFWSKGIENWTRVFDDCLKTFLDVMKDCEDTSIRQGRLKEDQRLSSPMQQSWKSGGFWIMYAVLNSFAFDAIYWQKIDPRFFGPTESPEEVWQERLDLLDEKEKDEMEQLVTQKLKEMESRVLAWDPDEYTVNFQKQLKTRGEANEEKLKADEAHKTEKDKGKENKSNEIKADADGTKASGILGTDTISDKLATTHLSG